ncbi:uncharacterized protein LOC135826664 [Sycon ciliatum]|uniref:uncharacterized protein LOC135826664 n=1 Tax=Sycon ciliatum TaxID=27933 RepID=UPI0031F65B83
MPSAGDRGSAKQRARVDRMATANVSGARASKEIGLTCKSEFREYHEYSGREKTWVVVSVQAPQCQEDEDGKVSEKDRAPLELVAVIDRSATMKSDYHDHDYGYSKLAMVQETMLFVIQQLNEHDKLGIVLYDEEVTSTGSLWRMDASGKAQATDIIQDLEADVGSNLCGGLMEGLAMIEDLQKENSSGDANAKKEKKSVSSILLMTDGEADEGFTSERDIIDCLTQRDRHDFYPDGNFRARHNIPARAQEPTVPPPPSPPQPSPQEVSAPATRPVVSSTIANSTELSDVVAASIYTFGFGADHNAELLQAVSKAGNGMYYYIDSSEKMPESFADCLGGLLSTAAQNISLEITAENGCNIVEAYAGRSTKSTHSGVAITLPLGDIQSEECRDCVFCLDLPNVPEECDEWVILKAKLTCFNVITSLLEVTEALLKVRRVKQLPADRSPNPDVDQHRNRITSAQVIEHASTLADKGDLNGAKRVLARQQAVIRRSASSNCPISKEMEKDMHRVTAELASPSQWKRAGKDLSSNISQKHLAQRSNDIRESSYTNRMKVQKKKASSSIHDDV